MFNPITFEIAGKLCVLNHTNSLKILEQGFITQISTPPEYQTFVSAELEMLRLKDILGVDFMWDWEWTTTGEICVYRR